MTSEYVPHSGFSPERAPRAMPNDQNAAPTWRNMTPKAVYSYSQPLPHEQNRQPLGVSNVANQQPVAQAPAFAAIKSPTTLCFERMLGAAASIATPKVLAKKKPANKRPKSLPGVLDHSDDASIVFDDVPIVPVPADDENENPFAIIQRDTVLFKKLVLTMALQRQPKESKENEPQEAPPALITEGFYWKDYPPCEQVLYDSMTTYYTLSKSSRQSKEQQVSTDSVHNLCINRLRSHGELWSSSGLQQRFGSKHSQGSSGKRLLF